MGNINSRLSRVLLVFSILCSSVGCTTWEGPYGSVQKAASPSEFNVSVGDTVKIVTNEDRKYEFEVVAITEDTVVGKNIEIRFDEIYSLYIKEIDKKKTTHVSAGTLLMGFLIAFAVAFASFSFSI